MGAINFRFVLINFAMSVVFFFLIACRNILYMSALGWLCSFCGFLQILCVNILIAFGYNIFNCNNDNESSNSNNNNNKENKYNHISTITKEERGRGCLSIRYCFCCHAPKLNAFIKK